MTAARLAVNVEVRIDGESEAEETLAVVSSRSVRPKDGRTGDDGARASASRPDQNRNGHDWREYAGRSAPAPVGDIDPGEPDRPPRKAPTMTIDKRNAAAVRRAHASPEAVAALVDACGWLDAALAAIVEAGAEAGAFAAPRAGRTWAVPWRAAHARQSLVFRALARRSPGFPVPAAHSTAALLGTLATLAVEPHGPSLLALVVERGPRPAVPAASSPSPRCAAPVSPAARVRSVGAEHSPSSEVRPVVQLLADVRGVFADRGDPERIASAELDRALHALPARPWGAMPNTDKPITPQARGRGPSMPADASGPDVQPVGRAMVSSPGRVHPSRCLPAASLNSASAAREPRRRRANLVRAVRWDRSGRERP